MRMPRFRFTVRRMMVVVAILAIGIGAYKAVYYYAERAMLRSEAANDAEDRRLYLDHANRLRGEVERLRGRQGGEASPGDVDRVFEMLRFSPVANNSREVDSWAKAPHSAARTSVALKWAEVAAAEAAFHASLRERWSIDYERGRWPHHVTNAEVPPFRIPAGWTEDDLK
jgi:hypothetical protein